MSYFSLELGEEDGGGDGRGVLQESGRETRKDRKDGEVRRENQDHSENFKFSEMRS